jgi:hypothetical protein
MSDVRSNSESSRRVAARLQRLYESSLLYLLLTHVESYNMEYQHLSACRNPDSIHHVYKCGTAFSMREVILF